MSQPEAPNFAVLLGPFIREVPGEGVPRFLALLERGAAERYREWAAQWPEQSEALGQCADREDEIADRIERLFQIAPEIAEKLTGPLPGARKTYADAFSGYSLRDQLRIQADAERQGAAAWRGIASQSDDAVLKEELEQCARLEEASADQVDAILEAA